MQGITARVKYRKAGLIRLIGHRDTARALLRAVRRAEIECVYSQGFSPRPRLSFGPPLPLGCTSECEYFDIKLARKRKPESVRESLQANLPSGLFVEEVEVFEGSCASLSSSFWAAEYEIELPQDLMVNGEKLERPCSGRTPAGTGLREAGDVGSSVLRMQCRQAKNGTRTLSLVLRRSDSGGVPLKATLSEILGIAPEELKRVRIHKKRVFAEGEEG